MQLRVLEVDDGVRSDDYFVGDASLGVKLADRDAGGPTAEVYVGSRGGHRMTPAVRLAHRSRQPISSRPIVLRLNA